MRTEIINEIVDYFHSEHWDTFLDMLDARSELFYHCHFYVNNQIDIESLQPIFEAAIAKAGLTLDREIDRVAGSYTRGALHGVHVYGNEFRPLVDWFWDFSDECYLKPMAPEKGEHGCNAYGWGKKYMDEWFAPFVFKCVGYYEEKAIQEWFDKSRQFKELLYLVEHFEEEGLRHLHCNVEINFDPKVLDMMARREFEKVGWKICNSTPCVYMVHDGSYRGKITYSLAHPEEVFDICWKYNPDVVIRPSQEQFVFPNRPDFDMWTVDMWESAAKKVGNYITLTDEEIAAVIAAL